MPRATPELVRHWLSEDNRQAIAGYGTSVEFLEQALVLDKIAWNQSSSDKDLLPYRKEILAGDGYLYFAFPFTKNLAEYKPSFVSKFRKELPEGDLSHDEAKNWLKYYARNQAIAHRFESLTGIKRDDNEIIALTYLLFPTLVLQFKDDEFFRRRYKTSTITWEEPPLPDIENPNMPLSQLKEVLAESISRRGIILYYNQRLLRNSIHEGFEDESEIMIHSKKPLALDVISGIEPLSQTDQEAVEDLINKLED